MAEESKPESERQDLLDRIDILKKQIKTFESELGINMEDLKRPRSEEESHVLHKMLESEKQLGVIENLMKKEATPPPTPHPEVKAPIQQGEEKLLESPHLKMLPHEEKPALPEDTLSNLHEKSKQIEQISSMVSRLRDNMQAVKQKPVQEEQPVQKPVEQKVQRGTDISKEDLPLVSNLIEKLDALIRSNEEVSERLRELISENRNVNTANRISDLVKKLAQAGLND